MRTLWLSHWGSLLPHKIFRRGLVHQLSPQREVRRRGPDHHSAVCLTENRFCSSAALQRQRSQTRSGRRNLLCPQPRRRAVRLMPTVCSWNLANLYFAILEGTLQARDSGLLQHGPTDAISRLQAQKIIFLKILPPAHRLEPLPPFLRQGRKHADHSAILVD